jgi:beta-galactosidase
MCSEFWDGWFDSWGGHHHTTPVAESAGELDELLALGASVNVYMFHGGTNFGFTNGANDKGVYQPIVTSYDYDAPLDEAGEPTEKYWAFRDVIAKHAPVPELEPVVAAAAPSFTAPFDVAVPLWAVADRLGDWVHTDTLPTFDQLGHYTGFGLYRTEIDTTEPAVLEFGEVRDRAYVSVGTSRLVVLALDHLDSAIALSPSRGTLTVLVEDQGRVDYGTRIGEPKGLVGPVQLNGEELRRWSVLPLQLSSIEPVRAALDAAAGDAAPERLAGPVFARAVFDLEEPGALFLDTTGWGKGVAWINGFNLGRYWTRGPQQTLYVPRGVVRAGRNELIVLELETAADPIAAFVPELRLGHTEV